MITGQEKEIGQGKRTAMVKLMGLAMPPLNINIELMGLAMPPLNINIELMGLANTPLIFSFRNYSFYLMNQRIKDKFILDSLYTNVAIKPNLNFPN